MRPSAFQKQNTAKRLEALELSALEKRARLMAKDKCPTCPGNDVDGHKLSCSSRGGGQIKLPASMNEDGKLEVALPAPVKVTTSGLPPEPGTEGTGAPGKIDPLTGQHTQYWVLSPEERAKGFVEPVRHSYRHVGIEGPRYPLRDLTDEETARYGDVGYVKYEEYPKEPKDPRFAASALGRFWTQKELDKIGKGCGSVTTMGAALAETYARSPGFYGSTFCCECREHLPVGRDGEFVWHGTNQRVGTRSLEENKPKPIKKAVCALITNLKGQILARSRKDDHTKFGLPGGKVDPGETLEQAIIREMKEETGLDFMPTLAVYTRPCLGETSYETTTFLGIARGELQSDEPGVVQWVDEQTLLDGPFGEYNKQLFDAVNERFGKKR